MKVFFKRIDSFLSSKLLGSAIGLYPNIIGLIGRLKLRVSKNKNSQEIIKNGYIEFGQALNNRITKSLNIALSDLESDKEVISLGDSIFISRRELEILKNSATLKILNGDYLLNQLDSTACKTLKAKIENFLSVKIKICNILIWRNFYTDDPRLFSGDWHFDRRPTHWLRLFILLEDVNDYQGPFLFVTKEESKRAVLQGFKRLDKNWQLKMNSNLQINKVLKFIGTRGSSMVVDTQNLLHRAGVSEPGHSRDMLEVVFKIS